MAESQSAFRDAEADVFAKPAPKEPPALRDGPSIRTPRAMIDAPALQPGAQPMSPLVYSGLVRFAEFSLVTGLGLLIAYGWVDAYFRQYAAALLVTGVITSFVFHGLGLYRTGVLAASHRHLPRLVAGWTATVGVLLAALFFLKVSQEFARGWIALWYLTGIAALIGFRAGVTAITRAAISTGNLIRRAVVYGTGDACAELIEGMARDPDNDIRVCAVFDERGPGRGGGIIAGYPNMGGIDALMAYCRSNPVDMLIVALPVSAESRVFAHMANSLLIIHE